MQAIHHVRVVPIRTTPHHLAAVDDLEQIEPLVAQVHPLVRAHLDATDQIRVDALLPGVPKLQHTGQHGGEQYQSEHARGGPGALGERAPQQI